jgi:hypothetical protein
MSNYGNPPLTNVGYNQSQMMPQSNFPNPLKIDHPPSEYYSQNQPSRSLDLEGNLVNIYLHLPEIPTPQ